MADQQLQLTSLPENPKAIHGRTKPSLALLPSGAEIAIAKVLELGASKYGPFNWRKDPVQAETYISAARRHMAAWFDGENIDPESGESHLAHAACCLMILLDADALHMMIDNRPYPGDASRLIAERTTRLQS